MPAGQAYPERCALTQTSSLPVEHSEEIAAIVAAEEERFCKRLASACQRWENLNGLQEDWEAEGRPPESRPYLMYHAVIDPSTRPEHRQWDGIILPADHTWWATHSPPNGFKCRCRVQYLSFYKLKRRGYVVSPDPQVATWPWRNPRTGEIEQMPFGIDPGCAVHPLAHNDATIEQARKARESCLAATLDSERRQAIAKVHDDSRAAAAALFNVRQALKGDH